MKVLSRTLTLALAVLFILCAAGCSKGAENGEWERTMRWNPGRSASTFSDEGYYYNDRNGQLCFLDLKNGGNVVLCSKVACLHSKEPDIFKRRECEAITGASSMFFWDNSLYYIAQDVYGYQLYRRAADGTAEEHIMTLGTNYISKNTSMDIWSLALAEGILYYYGQVCDDIQISQNEIHSQRSYDVICRVDLRVREETEIIRDDGGGISIHAVRNDAVLYTCIEGVELPEDVSDPTYIEKLQSAKVWLKQWNLQDGSTDILLEKVKKEMNAVVGYYNGKIYYNDANFDPLWSYDLKTREIAEAGPAHTLDVLSERYLIAYNEENLKSIYDVQAGTFIENAFPDTDLKVENVGRYGFILRRLYYTPEEGASWQQKTVYSFVTIDALAEGLQKTDVLDFYTYLLEQ